MENNNIDEERIFDILSCVVDPDVHVNIVDLGLIYSVRYNNNQITIDMTLTSPTCPMADFLQESAKDAVKRIYPEKTIVINLTFDPPWNSNMISEKGKMELGLL